MAPNQLVRSVEFMSQGLPSDFRPPRDEQSTGRALQGVLKDRAGITHDANLTTWWAHEAQQAAGGESVELAAGSLPANLSDAYTPVV